eukprot:2821628-Pleurochrysis_carterae.AAC.2
MPSRLKRTAPFRKNGEQLTSHNEGYEADSEMQCQFGPHARWTEHESNTCTCRKGSAMLCGAGSLAFGRGSRALRQRIGNQYLLQKCLLRDALEAGHRRAEGGDLDECEQRVCLRPRCTERRHAQVGKRLQIKRRARPSKHVDHLSRQLKGDAALERARPSCAGTTEPQGVTV